jgi:hypothetical protein
MGCPQNEQIRPGPGRPGLRDHFPKVFEPQKVVEREGGNKVSPN